MTFVDRLVEHWKVANVRPDARVTRDAISKFENQFGISLPPDVRAFYERFNGLLDLDSDLNRFWPISELDSVAAMVEPYSGIPEFSGIVSRLSEANSYFAFADHSIWVMVYAVRLCRSDALSSTVICIADGRTFDKLSDTFAGFWELYLASPDRILVP